MAQGKGGGQDSSGEDGMGPDAFGGGPQGSPSGDHPDNDPSTGLNYGGNQTDADLNPGFDFGNLNQIGIQGASTNQQNTNFDPAAASVGVNYDSQNTLDDVDYGYYDTPNPDHSSVLGGPATMSGANMSPGYQGAVSPSQNPSSVTHDFDIDTALQNSVPTTGVSLTAPLGTESNALGMEEVASFTAPTSIDVESFDSMPAAPVIQAPHALDVIAQANVEQALAAKNAPTTSPTTAPTIDLGMDAKEKALKQALGYEQQYGLGGFTESQFEDIGKEIRALPTRQQQLDALKEFYAKYDLQIEQHKKNWAKDHPINPAVPGLGMMGSALAGLLGMMGIDPQINSPALDALEQHARTLGLFDKESGEITEADMMKTCNATTGYIWNTATKTCDAINPSDDETADSDEIYNPYLGMV